MRSFLKLMTCCVGLLICSQAFAQQTCKPSLAFIQVHYPGMQLPKLERTWSAVLSVDASRCLTTTGRFEIVYALEKENALDYEVREPFQWRPGAVMVSKDFWIDETVAAYRVDNIATCPCRN